MMMPKPEHIKRREKAMEDQNSIWIKKDDRGLTGSPRIRLSDPGGRRRKGGLERAVKTILDDLK